MLAKPRTANAYVGFWLTKGEKTQIVREARTRDMNLTTYIRQCLHLPPNSRSGGPRIGASFQRRRP
jgi:hypothetical protein